MMWRFALALMLLAAPAAAKGKHVPKADADNAPHYGAVESAAEACTADGAFGHRFSRERYGHIDSVAGSEWEPFTRLSINDHEIRAEASFRGVSDDLDGDIAAAKKFLREFEKAADKKDTFPHKKKHNNGVELYSGEEPDTGLHFLIRQDDERITATCINQDR